MDCRANYDKPVQDGCGSYTGSGGAISTLVRELVLAISDQQIQRLERAIERAQASPPADKYRFAREVNRLLDAYQLRIQVDDAAFYRLSIKPGYKNIGYIQLAGGGAGGSRGGFAKSKLKIVRVPANYVGSRRPQPP